MNASEVDQRLQFALNASQDAAGLVMRHYLDPHLGVDQKADHSPVTIADRGAEELLRKAILDQFPDDSVMGEEYGETLGTSGYRWVLDPVDGTKSFVHGVPLFGMLMGLQSQGMNIAGICRMPALGEVVYAQRGGGCWWKRGNSAPVRASVSSVSSLKDALFCFTAVEGFAQIGRMDALTTLSEATRLSRSWGDCYGHILVATGRADLMVDPMLAEWDASALIPIVEEAGGRFFSWSGETTAVGGNGISSTPALKSAILGLLQDVTDSELCK
ncbi:MAG: histidinol phosphate phosphatase [Planctomycetaceae bacterium]|nr:histidinol phosphate phosphatase [Planctomycetaceae bacterium]